MKFLTALFFAASFNAVAQGPQVPHKMQFAGMTLTIRDDARREIQKDVDAITLSPKYFNIKVERAKTYFPIIEKIFAEEGVPDDFKYLVLQESALIADAVSTSNAVGFWQFKEFTALEMGLRVDKEIDERLNIAAASRGAAKYIKKNNFFFNNWLYALQAYQMGAGGVMQSVKESQGGATHMEITSKTYWYVKKYLAHKVAYEEAVKGKARISLITYENKTRKTLTDLSKEISVDEVELKNYNKWAKRGSIPEDRTYLVFIPVVGEVPASVSAVAAANTVPLRSAGKSPGPLSPVKTSGSARINGISTIIAVQGDTPAKLAARATVDLSAFLKWNDITISESTAAGQTFLLGKKRARAMEAYHKVQPGEDLWMISQRYGVQMRKLRKYNRIKSDDLTPGATLWLASMKPRDAANAPVPDNVVEVDNKDTFTWNADPVTPAPQTELPKALPEIEAPRSPVDSTTAKKDDLREIPVSDSVQTLQAVVTPVASAADSSTITVIPPVVKKETHTVQAGETLYAIAKQYDLAVMDLVRWNNLDLQQGIKPGQLIKLSDSQAVTKVEQGNTIFHEVKASDTLFSIARKYGVTIKELMDWNEKKDFSLSTGEKLKVVQK